jgi:hypothetical protein
VFEIASKETWNKDLQEKPAKYAQMGVQEYFAYDPNDPPIQRGSSRLSGWRLDPVIHQMREMPLRADGSLWSIHLESLLLPDGPYLRLYDSHGQRRLTKAEAEERRADAEAEARQVEARRAEAEAEARQAEAKRADALAEKLRSLGIDPNQI